MRILVQLAAIAVAANAAFAQGNFEAITNSAPSPSLGGSFSGSAGWTFTTSESIEITNIGVFKYVVDLNGPTLVGLWDNSGHLLASNLVTSSSTFLNQSLYTGVDPVLLSPSEIYHIGVFTLSGNNISLNVFVPGEGGFVEASDDIQLRGYAQANDGFAFPPEIGGPTGTIILGPNFLFSPGVPEPSAAALFGLGVMAFLYRFKRRR